MNDMITVFSIYIANCIHEMESRDSSCSHTDVSGSVDPQRETGRPGTAIHFQIADKQIIQTKLIWMNFLLFWFSWLTLKQTWMKRKIACTRYGYKQGHMH